MSPIWADDCGHIQQFEQLTQALHDVIDTRLLTPIQTVTIGAHSDLSLVCVFKAPNSVATDAGAGKIRSLEYHVNINMSPVVK